MACQSLDNDEILNVRWATEDPNPTSKVSEKRRLEDLGREAIRARMDPRIVDAMRAVRALEDGEAVPGADEDVEYIDDGRDAMYEDAGEMGPTKRRRLEAPAVEEAEVEQVREELGVAPATLTGLLNKDTLEGLKYFAEIRKRKEAEAKLGPVVSAKPLPNMGLADYGSDEDD